jgi:hypothetical protein
MEKLIHMQLNEREIVLPRQLHIRPFVLGASVGPAIMFLQAAMMTLSRYYEQMKAIREGFADSYHPDETFFLAMVSFDVITALLFILWIVLRVRYYRSLAGTVYRISQAGIQLPTPVSWWHYEAPFPTLIAWSEIKALVHHYPATSQATVPMFGIVLWDYDAWLARQFQEQRPGFLRRWSLRIQARKISRLTTPINIRQGLLPVSIDALMREITVRFAPELREHHITLLDGNRRISIE